ncbi:hypothetical protein FRC01_011657, partial [Tulasnella sp. 417]
FLWDREIREAVQVVLRTRFKPQPTSYLTTAGAAPSNQRMHAPSRPPSPDAVGQAISLLLDSVRRGRDASESNIIEHNRERDISELEVAASAIHDELLRRAAVLKRQRNSSQWIYRLPQEVFTEILIFDIKNDNSEEGRGKGSYRRKYRLERPKPPRRTQLCNVSHRFIQTIMGTPRIWSDIRCGKDDYTRCLQMSAQAPLSIRCYEHEGIEILSPASFDQFLRDVWDNSWRWKSLSLQLRFNSRRVDFLEFTAPQIRNVAVENLSPGFEELFGGYEPVTSVLKIIGNPTLRNLSLNGIGLQWNDLDFSHLGSLSLTNVQEGAPGFERLVEMLRMASGLEHLVLQGVDIFSSTEEQALNSQPIHLTSLLSLWLDKLPAGLADRLIRVIRFPRLKSMRVRGLLPEHLENPNSDQNPYHHFFQILIPVLSSSTDGITLFNETFSRSIYLNTDRWVLPWEEGATIVDKTADFGVDAQDPGSAMHQIANFITSNHIVVPLTIAANGDECFPDGNSSPTPGFLAEVLGKLPTVTKISALTLTDALNIMAILGSTQRDEESGRLGWIEGITPEHYQEFSAARYGDVLRVPLPLAQSIGPSPHSSGASAGNPIEYNRDREISELEVAASAIHDEVLLRAAVLKRHRNSFQWIHRLPQGLLAEILMLDILNSHSEEFGSSRRIYQAERPSPPRRTQLCNVSHHFLQTIMNTPRIWSNIRWGRDDHARCLQMSAQAPLSIRCSENERMRIPSPASIVDFLRDVWGHSWRWKSLSLQLRIGVQRLDFLEFTAPQIRDLTIENLPQKSRGALGGYNSVAPVFKIFGRPTFRNLSLKGIGLQWNDLDFSHLRSLSLISVEEGAPSLEILIQTLKMASGLEHLTLHEVDIISSTEVQESQSIHLPSLLSLWLDKLPEGVADQIIRLIRFSRLKSVRVRGLFIEHLKNSNSDQNPYHHFFQSLIRVISSSEDELTLFTHQFSGFMCLTMDRYRSLPWPEGCTPEKTADFGVGTWDPRSGIQKWANFLASNCIVAPLTIYANGYDYAPETTSSTTEGFPVEVLGKLPMVTRICPMRLSDALNIMTLLGSTRRDEKTGRLGWPCPELKVLNFGEVQGLTPEHYQNFLDARYGDGSPLVIEGEVVHRPPMVKFEESDWF